MATRSGDPTTRVETTRVETKAAQVATAGIDLLVAEAAAVSAACAAASADLKAIDDAPVAPGASAEELLSGREAAVRKAALTAAESLARLRKVLAGIVAAPPAGEQ